MNPIILNYSQCIKQEAHWGYDKWHNICNGTWNSVNWGSFDWTVAMLGPVFLLAAATAFIAMAVGVTKAANEQEKMMKQFDLPF